MLDFYDYLSQRHVDKLTWKMGKAMWGRCGGFAIITSVRVEDSRKHVPYLVKLNDFDCLMVKERKGN